MNPAPRIPATIVTGFLGAGKTTLIRQLIAKSGGRRIALIVNEFGDMGFDGALLSDCGDDECRPDEVVELTNGCICCTVADDFLPTMQMLIARDPAPDHIVIETSGLALPQPLIRAFSWPDVRHRVTVDGVVAVVDGRAVADGRVAADEAALAAQRAADPSLDHDDPVAELFEDQLRSADLIVVSKSDLVAEDEFARIEATIAASARPAARRVRSAGEGLPVEVLLGLAAAAEDDADSRLSHHEMEGEDHDHDEFESFVVEASTADSLDALKARVETAMAVPGVLRVKGHAAIAGKPVPAIVQAVGPRVEAAFAPGGGDRRLVVIGLAGMDRDAIAAALAG